MYGTVIASVANVLKREFRLQEDYEEHRIRILHICQLSISMTSFVIGSIGIVFWFKMDPTKRMALRCQFFIAIILTDWIKAFVHFFFNATRLHRLHEIFKNPENSSVQFCDGWGFMINAATCSADCTILFFTVHNIMIAFLPRINRTYERRIILYNVIRNNLWDVVRFRLFPTSYASIYFRNNHKKMLINEGGLFRWRWPLTIFLHSFSLISSSLAFVNGGHYQANHTCAVPYLPIWKRLLASFIVKYINLVVIPLTYICIVSYILFKYHQLKKARKVYQSKVFQDTESLSPKAMSPTSFVHANFQKELLATTFNDTETRIHNAMKDLKSFFVYPLGYFLVWLAPAVSEIRSYIDKENPDPYGLSLIIALTTPMSCSIDVIIFLIIEKPWNLTTKKLVERGLFSIEDTTPYAHTQMKYNLNIIPTTPNRHNNNSKEDYYGSAISNNTHHEGGNNESIFDFLKNNAASAMYNDRPSLITGDTLRSPQIRRDSVFTANYSANPPANPSASLEPAATSIFKSMLKSVKRVNGAQNEITAAPSKNDFFPRTEHLEDRQNDDQYDFMDFLRNSPMNNVNKNREN